MFNRKVNMIQDIAPKLFDISFQPTDPNGQDSVLLFRDDQVLVRASEDLSFPQLADLTLLPEALRYLFAIDGQEFYLALAPEFAEPVGFVWRSTRELRSATPRYLAFAGITARHLQVWYAANRFCGHCGQVLQPSTLERALVCSDCGNIVYPKICPAVIVGVTSGDQLLMTRYTDRPQARFALIAGFVEVGESAEDTVRREVWEEVGLKVKNLRYYKSQPWGFSESLLLGYFAELDGPAEITLQTSELSEALFVPREQIAVAADGLSLTNEMIQYFQRPPFSAAFQFNS